MDGGAIFALFAIALFLVIGVGLPLWVYSDASSNSPHSPFLWALVVFLAPLLGLVLYFLIGRSGGGRRGRASAY